MSWWFRHPPFRAPPEVSIAADRATASPSGLAAGPKSAIVVRRRSIRRPPERRTLREIYFASGQPQARGLESTLEKGEPQEIIALLPVGITSHHSLCTAEGNILTTAGVPCTGATHSPASACSSPRATPRNRGPGAPPTSHGWTNTSPASCAIPSRDQPLARSPIRAGPCDNRRRNAGRARHDRVRARSIAPPAARSRQALRERPP